MSLAALSVHDRRLMSAVKRNYVCLARNLLKNSKININCAEENGTTCLHIAIRQHNIRMVELLLAHNIEVNPDMSRFEVMDAPAVRPPLIEAIQSRSPWELVKLLITAGADVNAEFKGKSPLILAVCGSESPIVELLLESGADVPVSTGLRDSYLFTAMQYSHSASVIKRLIERISSSELKHTNNHGHSYLTEALILCKDEEVIKILLDRPEIDPLATTIDGSTSMHFTVSSIYPRVKSVRWLLDRGVDLNATTLRTSGRYGLYTPLHLALLTGNSEMAKEFINLGADVNAKSVNGTFPLYLATKYCSTEIVELLISKGANVHDKNFSGETALHICIDEGAHITDEFSENIRTLLIHGANPLAKDDSGYTVLQTLATHNGHYLDAAKETIRRLAAIRKVEDKRIDDGDINLIFLTPEFYTVWSICFEDIDAMRKTKVYENVTLFRLFSMNEDKLAKMMNNKTFIAKLLYLYATKDFPIFEDYISAKLQRAEKKMRTYRALKQHLLDTDTPITHLPDVVLDHLIGYLTIEDLPEGHRHCIENKFF